MGKILAIVFLALFAWFAIPRLAQAQWFAPTLYPSSWWGQPVYDYSPRLGQQGFGWFNFGLSTRYNSAPIINPTSFTATSYYGGYVPAYYAPVQPTMPYGFQPNSFRPTTGSYTVGPGYGW